VSIVLDASLTLSWYFEDECTPAVDAVLDEVVAGPGLWRLDVANGFQMAMRRKRMRISGTARSSVSAPYQSQLTRKPIAMHGRPRWVLPLSWRGAVACRLPRSMSRYAARDVRWACPCWDARHDVQLVR
jgi:hypothetical protein